jgi:short subunit dehydrogenase-like uncharacterized protein
MAKELGLQPLIAGRDSDRTEALAREMDFPCRVFDVSDPEALRFVLKEVKAVLHCAGPFEYTCDAMSEACLETGVHYLDITGEIAVFEKLHQKDAIAREKGVMLLPGTGFDVVPSDCLARHLSERMPGAVELVLAFRALGGVSHGTASTMVENLHRGGMIRKEGVLTAVPHGWDSRKFPFGEKEYEAVSIPWGDVSTAYYSTGIPNISVYMTMPPRVIPFMRFVSYFDWLFKTEWFRQFLKNQVKKQPAGPSDTEREEGESLLYGEVRDGEGNRMVSTLRCAEGYTLTAQASLHIVQKVLAGKFSPGFQTPSSAYGKELVMELPGVTRMDIG